MKKFVSLLCATVAVAFLSGCTTGGAGGSYKVTAYKPHNPNDVVVKVSTYS